MKWTNRAGITFDVKYKNSKRITKADLLDVVLKKKILHAFKERPDVSVIVSYFSLKKHSRGCMHYYIYDRTITYSYRLVLIGKASGVKVGIKYKRLIFKITKKEEDRLNGK